MQSKATSVKEYLASLPADRRAAIEQMRTTIKDNLDPAFEEGMQYGMIGYYVPHSRYPAGYHCDPSQPLPFAGLASQSGHMSLYLCWMYYNSKALEDLKLSWAQTGKKLNMGACCIRFKKIEDVPLDVIGRTIKSVPVAKFIQMYDAVRPEPKKRSKSASTGAAQAKKAPRSAKKSAKKTAKKSAKKKASRKAPARR